MCTFQMYMCNSALGKGNDTIYLSRTFHFLILWFYLQLQNRQAIHKGQRGCREAAGTSARRAAEVVQDPPARKPSALRLPPGPPDRVADVQSSPRGDADVLASQRPQVHPAALRNLGRAVMCAAGRGCLSVFRLFEI